MKFRMKKMAWLVMMIFIVTGAAKVQAEGESISAKIVTFGPINTESATRVKDPSTPSGTSVNAKGMKIIGETDQVTAEIGKTFGYEYLVVGLPFNQLIDLKEVYAYPEMTMPDGKTSTGYSRVVKKRTDSFGIINYIQGYVLEQPYELVPGAWKMELWYDGRKLVEKEFHLSAPADAAENQKN